MTNYICGYRGEVISKAGPEEAVIYADIGEWEERFDDDHVLSLYVGSVLNLSVPTCDPHPDLQYLSDIRQQIPITAQRRDDLYTVTTVKEGSSWSLRPRERRSEGNRH